MLSPAVTLTVPHATCVSASENQCDQLASRTWPQFVAAAQAHGITLRNVFVGRVPRLERDLNRGSVDPSIFEGATFVIDYHSDHVAKDWYVIISPSQEALLGDAARQILGAGRCRRGTAANAIAEAAAVHGLPCLIVEARSERELPGIASALQALVSMTRRAAPVLAQTLPGDDWRKVLVHESV